MSTGWEYSRTSSYYVEALTSGTESDLSEADNHRIPWNYSAPLGWGHTAWVGRVALLTKAYTNAFWGPQRKIRPTDLMGWRHVQPCLTDSWDRKHMTCEWKSLEDQKRKDRWSEYRNKFCTCKLAGGCKNLEEPNQLHCFHTTFDVRDRSTNKFRPPQTIRPPNSEEFLIIPAPNFHRANKRCWLIIL